MDSAVMQQNGADRGAGGKYVYSVVRSRTPLSFGPIGIGEPSGEVYTLHHEDLAAVVSDSPLTPYDPTEENLLAHERVNQEVLKSHTVLPLAFGSQFRSGEDVVELMRRAYDALQHALNNLEGRAEFGLQATWDPQRALAALQQANPEFGATLARLAQQGGPEGYFQQVELGRKIQDALHQWSSRYVNRVLEVMQPVTASAQVNEPIGDQMVLNAAFLVDRAREDEFVAAAERVAAEFEEELAFRLSGPWPPYNFVRIQVRAQG